MPEKLDLFTATGERKYLTQDERKAFVLAASELPERHERTFCLTLVHSGCRISEALALNFQRIDMDAGQLVLPLAQEAGWQRPPSCRASAARLLGCPRSRARCTCHEASPAKTRRALVAGRAHDGISMGREDDGDCRHRGRDGATTWAAPRFWGACVDERHSFAAVAAVDGACRSRNNSDLSASDRQRGGELRGSALGMIGLNKQCVLGTAVTAVLANGAQWCRAG